MLCVCMCLRHVNHYMHLVLFLLDKFIVHTGVFFDIVLKESVGLASLREVVVLSLPCCE